MDPPRMCYNPSQGVSIEKRKNGRFEVTGLINFQIELIKSILDIPQLLNFTIVPIKGGDIYCIESFAQNETDFAFGLYQMSESNELFYVPQINSGSSVLILSGYEVNSYIESQKNKTKSVYGLMDNVFLYDWQTYLAIFALLFAFVGTYALLLKIRTRKSNSKSVAKFIYRLLQHLERSLSLARTKWKMHSFLFFVALFFISSPFFMLFNTSQVVTERPFIISNMESVMSAGVGCWHGDGILDALIEPSPGRKSADDLKNRFWKYFQEHRLESPKPRNLAEYLNLVHEIARKIVDKEIVYLTQAETTVLIHTLSCVVSKENEYFRTFYFKDGSSKEVLVGSAFRKGFHHPTLIHKLSSKLEFGIAMPLSLTRPTYDFSLVPEGVDRKHRRKQLELCLDKDVVAYQRETTYSNDVSFFLAFWLFLAALVTLALFVHGLEVRNELASLERAKRLRNRKVRTKLHGFRTRSLQYNWHLVSPVQLEV